MTNDREFEGTWVVTAYRAGEGMVEPDPRAEASLIIDGTLVAGTMGVNRFSGRLDDDLPMGPLVTTRMAGPADLMDQEETLLEHLQTADSAEVSGDGMFLTSDGLVMVELERTGNR